MKFSQSFIPLLRESPQEASIASHQWMLRSGLVQQLASGLYSWLPLGTRVLHKICHIVRQEHTRIGVQEAIAPTLQPASLWQASGRYEDYGKEMLRIVDRHEQPLLYGPTAEEVFTVMFKSHGHSYKQLPQCLYNIQWKFRDEVRPRFGVMRAREFLMKDAYSFDLTPQAAAQSYAKMFQAYMRIFRRMDLLAIPMKADTGPIGGDLSHEFHIVAPTGESELYYDPALLNCLNDGADDLPTCTSFYAQTQDKHDPSTCPIPESQLHRRRGIEVGHIFYFGTKYSQAMQAFVTQSNGQKIPVEMGSYGIGISRLVGAIIEANHDEQGVKWPVPVAPYTVGLASFKADYAADAQQVYETLWAMGIDTLWMDDEKSAGEKMTALDMIGTPFQVRMGKGWANGDVEIKQRSTGAIHIMNKEQALNWLHQHTASLLIALP
jgi:prolyl-tRNA synthetase